MRSVNISGNLRGNQVLLISLVHYMAKLHFFFFSLQRYGLWFSLKSAIHFFANHLGKVSIRLGKFSLQLINMSILMSCWLNNVINYPGRRSYMLINFGVQRVSAYFFTYWLTKRNCWDNLVLCQNLYINEFFYLKYFIEIQSYTFNPLTPKIWILIFSSSYYTSPGKLVMRIWC